MGFEKLQQRLKAFFLTETAPTKDLSQQARIRERVLTEFARKKSSHSWLLFWKSRWVRSATIGAIVLSLLPIFGSERSAGELRPTGLVEIVRDGEVFVVTGKTSLQVGDQILVGNKSSAKINLRKSLNTVAGERAEIRVPRRNSLFLVKGSLDGDLFNGSIETGRGKIDSSNDAALNISVSDSGETLILPRKHNVLVTSWDKTKTTLAAGEELRLRTDGVLPPEIPENLNLSSSQILAIQAKLLIARTKALNSIETRLLREDERAMAELESADRTFISIAQVLKSSRDLQMIRRENLALISRDTVVKRLSDRTERINLLENARAVETLLNIVEQKRAPEFLTIDSGLIIFNRYALLQRLFAPLPERQRYHGRLLQKQYVNALAQQIVNADSPAEEIRFITSVVPKSGAGRQFLQQVAEILPVPLMSQLSETVSEW